MLEMWENISFLTISSAILFVLSLFLLPRNKTDYLVMAILGASLASDTGALYCVSFDLNMTPVYNLYFLVHHGLWIYLILYLSRLPRLKWIATIGFLLSGLVNLLFFERFGLNYSTFLMGAFLYLGLYIFVNAYLLNKEQLEWFSTPQFVLVSAPIVFFLGMGFVFGFRESELRSTEIGGYNLYFILARISNVFYHLMLLLYLIRGRRKVKLARKH